MNRKRFRLQAVFVIVLIVLVTWPQWRPIRATSVWRAHGPLETQRQTSPDRRFDYGDDTNARVGYGSLATQDDGDASKAAARKAADHMLANRPRYDTAPAEMVALGARLNAIVGRARTNLNAPVPYARLILRNLITGQIEARATADQEGRFTFIDVGESGYIIELIGSDGSVVASSETVAVANGDMKQATVRVSAAATVRALYGNVVAPTVSDPVRTAVEAGVDRITQPATSASPL